MKRLLNILSPIIFICALILVIGAPGAIDFGNISLSRGLFQMIGGLSVIWLILRLRKVV